MNSYCNTEISRYETGENTDLDASYYCAFKKYVVPYLDHCYATGLPTVQFDSHAETPPLPMTEPLAAYIEIEEVGVRGVSHGSMGITSTASTGKKYAGSHSVVKNSGHNNGSITNIVTSNNGGDIEVDPYEGSVTRCICDFQHDDGYMICCDRCGVWQHVECMGVDGKHIPDSYLCELCYPRLVDKRRAVRIQSKKKEELEMEESSGSADDSVEEESRRPKRRGRKREQGRRKNHDRLDPGIDHKKSHQKRKRTSSEMEGKKHSDGVFGTSKEQKRLRPQSFTNFDINGPETWELSSPIEREAEAQQFRTSEGAAKIQCNTYSAEVLNLLVLKVKTMGSSNVSNVIAITQQLSKKCFKVVTYDDNSKGLEALESIKPNQTVAEYTGKTVMRREYERNQSDLSYPFTVCYMGINGVELCVDSNDFNNEAKFVRRSCTPNAKVVHLLEKTGLRFFICATKTIPCGKEITIPFYFDYQRSTVELKCPCGKFNCMVAKHFKRMTGGRSSSSTTLCALASPHALASISPSIAATSVISQQRPARQSKKRVLDECAEGIEDEDNRDKVQTSAFDRCHTGVLVQISPMKGCNLGEVSEQMQKLETRSTVSGKTVKFSKGKSLLKSTSMCNNDNEKGSFLASMLQAHLARNSNLSRASLAPMTTSVGDDIVLLNKLSSVEDLHLTDAKFDQSDVTEISRGKQKEIESIEVCQKEKEISAEKFDESCQLIRRQQLMSHTKEMLLNDESKDLRFDVRMKTNVHMEQSIIDRPTPKEKRKNSKLLAEIQTFFGSDRVNDNKDQGERKVSTREQRKIEAAERRFERIEKSSARSSRGVPSASPNNQKLAKTRSSQHDEKSKKLDETEQKNNQKNTSSKSTKIGIAKSTILKTQKLDEKFINRQQLDKGPASSDRKKSEKVVMVPTRLTRSSKK